MTGYGGSTWVIGRCYLAFLDAYLKKKGDVPKENRFDASEVVWEAF